MPENAKRPMLIVDEAGSVSRGIEEAAPAPKVEPIVRASDFSRFYTLEEITATSHGPNPVMGCTRYGILVTSDEIKNNLRALCADVLDPLCETYGKVTLSSCYRGPLVNAAVGGSNNSAHTAGLAADTQPKQAAAAVAFFARNWRQANLDRIIFETRGPKTSWLHLQRLQRGAPARDPKDAKFFLSPSADKYVPIGVEALMAMLLSISKKEPTS
jgi:hypothetical protein